jgi:hypothetical protein
MAPRCRLIISTTHAELCAPICPFFFIYSLLCGDPHAWSKDCTALWQLTHCKPIRERHSSTVDRHTIAVTQ